MNNIYKVIWSKAKNCYVVASEIARSHTKSASGSEKIGGVTRRSLLASLMALSLLCGGLGVASAVDVVHVDESASGGIAGVYTTTKVDTELGKKADKTDVEEIKNTVGGVDSGLVKKTNDNATGIEVNRTSINALKDTVGDDTKGLTKKINDNATAINTLTTNVNAKADANTVNDISTRVGTLETTVGNDTGGLVKDVNEAKTDITNIKNTIGDASSGLVKDVADLKTQGNDLNTAIGNKADQSALVAATDRITTNETNIFALQKKTTGLSADGKSLNGMNSVETDALMVKGEIKNGAGVTTTLTDIKASMDKANANETAIGQLQTTTTDQQTAIDKLKEKTEDISHMAGGGTNISGVTIKDGNILGNGNSAITGLTNVETGSIKTDSINGKSLTGTNVATEKNVADAVKTETDARIAADNALEGKINDEKTAREAADAKINTKIGNIDDTRTVYVKDANSISQNLTTLDEKLQNTNDRTGGIKRNTEDTQTTIENKVTVNGSGDVDGVKGLSAETINTTGDAGIGGKLNVTGASDLKGDVTLGTPNGTNTVTVNGTADFNAAVKMNNGLNVINGETNLKNTTVDGDLKVTGTITTDKMVFGDKPTNYTEIDHGKVTSKNLEVNGAGQAISSSSTFDVEKNEVGFGNGITGDHSYHKQTAKGINGSVTDKDGNKTYTKVTATENSFQVQDKDGKNKNHQVNTKDSSVTEIKNGDGKTTKTEQTATDITNTAKNGTITNDANHIENTATTMKTTVTGKATESYGELETTVTGQATENFNGGLNTTVTGTENHTVTKDQNIHVTGKQTNTVEGGQENIISGGQKNNILTGDQETTVSNGSIINKAETGNISNTAKNVTNEGTESVTNKVGNNEVKVSQNGVDITAEAGKKITESVGTASRVVENDKITDKAADSTVTTENGKGTTFGKEGSTGTTNIYGDSIRTGTINAEDTTTAKLTAGAAAGADGGRLTVDASDGVKGSYKSGDYTSRSYILANTLKSGVDNGKEPTEDDFVGSRTDHYMDGNKAKLDETVKNADGSNVTNKTSTGTVTTITDGTTTTKTDQGVKDITNTAKNGTITNDAKDIVNIAKDTITNTAGTSITNQVNDSKVTTDANGTTFENNTPAVSDSGATTTKINGNQITTGRVNANELDVSDTDGNNKADLLVEAGEGVKASASDGNTTGSLDVKADGITTSITNGTDHNTVSSTLAGGTIFTNSEAAAPVTGASGAGTAVNTTIKGNTITTGKVTMDYAEVMKDLGVHGNAKVDNDLTVKGITNTKTLNVTEDANVGRDLAVGGNATIAGDVTARSYKVDGKTYIDANGIHANGQKITDVADGSISEGSKDAVNGGQLYGVKRDLEHQVDKVGANAAAMANLRPMEFDPSSKWNIAAAIGNYGSETAAALGAFYRPNDDVMVNLSTAFGTGENMVGGGVSVRLGKSGNKLSREENNALKAQVDDLTARMDALLSVLNPNMSKDFPDVPENHWAYEAVSRLAGNDIVQGYPDGEFHGERTMTRYEMAEIIYNALSRGAEAERELVEEFKPELQAMAASEKATAEKAEG